MDDASLPFHLTTVKDGPPIAKVKGSKGLGGATTKLYVADGPGPTSFEASGLQLVPYTMKGQRVAVYIVGAAGSGKSVWIANAIKAMPKKQTLLFTTASELDPAFDKDKVVQIDYMADPEILNTFNIDDLQDSICIFDDFDNSTNPKINAQMQAIIRTVLENGRKLQIDVFVVSHNPRDYNRTRTLILECSTFVVFPQTNRAATLRFLREYFDDDRRFLERVKRISDGGRFTWVALHKSVPRYMVTEKSATLLE
tara:strand:+ start:1045 stop:1806 length:762 start_codon:yes stop_codon:yes gene_type:complete